MKRPLKPEELRLWGMVAGTVRPLPGRALPAPAGVRTNGEAVMPGKRGPAGDCGLRAAAPALAAPRPASSHGGKAKTIEPNRLHRIAGGRETLAARIDLHGMTQDQARAALEGFLRRMWDDGYRAVLVITGRGVQGDGVLRKRAPDWLGAPHLAHIVAGISEAHRRHGGEGALYVALKRKPAH